MNKSDVFDQCAKEYDEWFDVHPWVYQSELQAVRMLLPQNGKGIEIGVGTGRFSFPFGITTGVEPSRAMAEIAKSRGITVYNAKAENLPFDDNAFDYVLMVTAICFLEDPLLALREINRILRSAGRIIIGMLKEAKFYSVSQVIEWLEIAAYNQVKILQTLLHNPEEIVALEPIKKGHGEGLFVVISAQKNSG